MSPAAIDEAVRVIQKHLDAEARNRSLPSLAPRDLCPIQKVRLVNDLADVLERQDPVGFFGRLHRVFRR